MAAASAVNGLGGGGGGGPSVAENKVNGPGSLETRRSLSERSSLETRRSLSERTPGQVPM